MRWIDSRRSGRRQRRTMVDVSTRPMTARATDVPVASVSVASAVGTSGPLVLPVPPAAPAVLMAFAAYVPGPND